MFAARNLVMTSNQGPRIVIDVASTSGLTDGRLSLNCQANTTFMVMLSGYFESYVSSVGISATGSSGLSNIRTTSANSDSGNVTAKLFQGTHANAGTSTITPSPADTTYVASAAVAISGHQSITLGTTQTLATGTTSYTINPPSNGYAVVFLALQWGGYDATVISGSPTLHKVFADNRSAYTGAYIAVASQTTTLTINPAIRNGYSPGLLMQYNVT